MKFTVEYIEYALLVFVRIASILYVTPLFGNSNIPRKFKIGLAFFLSLIVFNLVDYNSVSYNGVIGYTELIVKEAITGILIGIGSGFCMYILNFSGNFLDLEMGFSMAMEMDPATSVQTTISSTLFTAVFMLMFLVTDMQYYIIDAIYDSFKLIPIGEASINADNLLTVFMKYILDFFVIGFRIILPIFACTLLSNVILGILAKVAPQMNMFVIGLQLKIFIGLFMLYIIMAFLPSLSDFLFQEMQKLTEMYMNILVAGS